MSTRSVARVDTRGRVSLAAYGYRDQDVAVDELDDGGLLIYPAVVLTPPEIRHYSSEDAIAALEAGIQSRVEGRVESGRLRNP